MERPIIFWTTKKKGRRLESVPVRSLRGRRFKKTLLRWAKSHEKHAKFAKTCQKDLKFGGKLPKERKKKSWCTSEFPLLFLCIVLQCSVVMFSRARATDTAVPTDWMTLGTLEKQFQTSLHTSTGKLRLLFYLIFPV